MHVVSAHLFGYRSHYSPLSSHRSMWQRDVLGMALSSWEAELNSCVLSVYLGLKQIETILVWVKSSLGQVSIGGTLVCSMFAIAMFLPRARPTRQQTYGVETERRCFKMLFTHYLTARGRMLWPVVCLSWRPAGCTCGESDGVPSECSRRQGGCQILCPLPCFSNWLGDTGLAPGRVYYILSGLRVMDTFQVKKWHTSCPGRVSVTSGRPCTKTLWGGKGKEWQRQLKTTLLSSSWLWKNILQNRSLIDDLCRRSVPFTCKNQDKRIWGAFYKRKDLWLKTTISPKDGKS